ncbi:UNVERIFIED_CONTAM: hypothetical protein FKN15_075934 [Acipenser sinensis]
MFAEITSLQDTDIDEVVWNNLLETELRIRRENGFNITTCGVGRPSLDKGTDQIDTNDLPADVILTRVEDLKEMFAEITSLQDTGIDEVVWNNLLEIELRIRRENGFNITTCGVGRPSLEVPLSTIVTYIQPVLSTGEIADLLGVSTSTIGRRMAQHGIRWRIVVHGGIDGFSRLIMYLSAATNNRATTVLDWFLSAVEQFGLLSRVRSDKGGENIKVAHYMVSRQGENRNSHITGRSVYNQRWRIVVHGGIDGFSQLIVYLSAATNNWATTVLDWFLSAVEQFGLLSRVRSDKGGENIKVAHYMVSRQGENRNSHITGRSVYNQRIERLWRDVFENVLDLFYTVFTSLESEGLLNPDKEIELFALHRCFVPQIQQHLFFFKDAWNHHGLRTAGNQSPLQLWLRNQREGEREDPPQVNISELNIKLWMSQNFLQLNKTEPLVIGSKTCSYMQFYYF